MELYIGIYICRSRAKERRLDSLDFGVFDEAMERVAYMPFPYAIKNPIHQDIYIKFVQFFVCQSYLNVVIPKCGGFKICF